MHKLFGDVPKAHKELAEELLDLEKFFDTESQLYEPSSVAKGFVLISHDWYAMGEDDKGYDLLQKAEKICPGYFKNEISRHIDEDPYFEALIGGLTQSILDVVKGYT